MPFNQIMCKVNFVLSGFVNPLKSELRSKALEMGAKYTEEWNSSCTHLVCAFANTPKHAQVHSAGGKIINKKWILDCYKERTLLPSEEYELGEGEEESSDVASESEEKTVTVAGKTIKRETSKYIVQKMNKKKHFNQIMSKVLFALSGFANPLRSKLRNKALKMGAKYRRDWNSSCTHLVCAFVNTPKYVKVQSAGGKIVTKKWILDCYKKKALLPWEKYELGEDEEESSDITSESEEESVAVSWKSIKRETSKYSDSKNDPANILNASLVIKQEIETEDEDPVQNCMAETNVQTNSGMVTEMKFIGSKSDPENIPNASFVMKKEIKDEDVVQDCMAELNVQTNSGLRMKSKFRGFKDGPANIVNASLVIKEEIETEDEDAVQDCMADANVPSNSGVIREMKFIGITKEERKIMKNVDEDKSSNWSFSNLSSKHDPVHNFNSSVAIKEEIETEDEDAVQDYMANTNTEINSVIKKMKFTGS
ncbi:DNA repair protein XRCC1, partial [Stegodyphus mimosarum]